MFLSQFAAHPVPVAVGVAVALVLLFGVWKLVKGVAKVILLLILAAAIVGILIWMGQGGPLTL